MQEIPLQPESGFVEGHRGGDVVDIENGVAKDHAGLRCAKSISGV
jgi:hypothetical protein